MAQARPWARPSTHVSGATMLGLLDCLLGCLDWSVVDTLLQVQREATNAKHARRRHILVLVFGQLRLKYIVSLRNLTKGHKSELVRMSLFVDWTGFVETRCSL